MPTGFLCKITGSMRAEPAGATESRASPGLADSEPGDDPELILTVFGARHKIKRSELVKTFDLEGLSDERIISVAQKEMAADQRLDRSALSRRPAA